MSNQFDAVLASLQSTIDLLSGDGYRLAPANDVESETYFCESVARQLGVSVGAAVDGMAAASVRLFGSPHFVRAVRLQLAVAGGCWRDIRFPAIAAHALALGDF